MCVWRSIYTHTELHLVKMGSYKLFYDNVHNIHFKSDVARLYSSPDAASRFYNAFQDLEFDVEQFFLVDINKGLLPDTRRRMDEINAVLQSQNREDMIALVSQDMPGIALEDVQQLPDEELVGELTDMLVDLEQSAKERDCYYLDRHVLDGTIVGPDFKVYRATPGLLMAHRAYLLNIAEFYDEWVSVLSQEGVTTLKLDLYSKMMVDRDELMRFLRKGVYQPEEGAPQASQLLDDDQRQQARAFYTLFLKLTSDSFSRDLGDINDARAYVVDVQLCLVTGRYTTRSRIKNGYFATEFEKISAYEVICSIPVKNLLFYMINNPDSRDVPTPVPQNQEQLFRQNLVTRRTTIRRLREVRAATMERNFQQEADRQALLDETDAQIRDAERLTNVLADLPQANYQNFLSRLIETLKRDSSLLKEQAYRWENANYTLLRSNAAV